MDAVELFGLELREAFAMVRGRIEGLTDEEFFWEPAPGCWSIHVDAHGRWVSDYAEPDPVPAPLTTIGWRLVHIAQCKLMYHEYAFGPAELTWWDIEVPHTSVAAIAMLDRGQALLDQDLEGLHPSDLTRPVATNWGEMWPVWKIFWAMVHHDLHHGGEIGALRDLYRVADGVAPPGA